jgi:thymidylate synthase (FAD)
LLNHTPNPVRSVAFAARLCMFNKTIDELKEVITDEYAQELVKKLIEMGHDSPTEHVIFTFGIEGISRACSHQLVRHRIASYSQQSQRYVNEKDFNYIVPPEIESNSDAKNIFCEHIETLNETYKKLVELGIKKEDARFVLPNACETKIICTFNIRSLKNFFKLRLDKHAQWEIRAMANQMFDLVYELCPIFFEDIKEKYF